MQNPHEPTDEFTEKLEWQIGREVRRRSALTQSQGWMTWSRGRIAAAAAALVLVSMAIGGAAVAAAYESQENQLRNQLVTNVEQRLRLAELRLTTLKTELATTEQRVAVGTSTTMELMESRNKVLDAEVQLQKVQLELEEVRLTGREARPELSAPPVSGRDFVGQRLRIETTGPERALELEKLRLADAQKRADIGVGSAGEVEAARVRVLEAQAALDTVRTKIEIRRKFVGGTADAKETELRVLEAEALQQKKVLEPKLTIARQEVQRVSQRVELGTAQEVDLATVKLRVLEQETALSMADLNLALIRLQISKLRKE